MQRWVLLTYRREVLSLKYRRYKLLIFVINGSYNQYLSTKLRDFELFHFIGPCSNELSGCRGTPCFMKSLEALEVQCTCLPKHSTTEDGRCYQPYTRGPCP